MMRLLTGRLAILAVGPAILAVGPAVLAVGLVLAMAGPAAAECFADYKAKQDRPLRLHYGVAQVTNDNCSRRAAAGELAPRLSQDGWTLLNVLSTFGPEGLDERRQSAGAYFLRY